MCPGAQLQPHTQLLPKPEPRGHPWPLLCTSWVDGAGKPSGLQAAQVCHTDPSAPNSSSLAWLTSFQGGRVDRTPLSWCRTSLPACCAALGGAPPLLRQLRPSGEIQLPEETGQQQEAAAQTTNQGPPWPLLHGRKPATTKLGTVWGVEMGHQERLFAGMCSETQGNPCAVRDAVSRKRVAQREARGRSSAWPGCRLGRTCLLQGCVHSGGRTGPVP